MLREALAAVRRQGVAGRVETLVVFDRSAPDHGLVRDDPHRPVRVLVNSRTPGLAGARNTGIEAARADLVAFCDDDDVWLPGKLEAQLVAMAGAPRAVLATCGIRVEFAGGTHERVVPRERVSHRDLISDRHAELHPSSFLVRRSALLGRLGLVEEEVPGGFGEDYDLLLRASALYPVVNVATPLVLVRWGAQSYFFRRWETMTAGLSWMLDHHDFDEVPRGSARVRGQVAFAQAASGRHRESLRWARQALRRNLHEPRAYLALAVSARLVTPRLVMESLHRLGRGI